MKSFWLWKHPLLLPVGLSLFISSCAALAAVAALPISAVSGGVSLVMTGAEVEKSITKADFQQAYNLPFEETWSRVGATLISLQIPIENAAKNKDGDAAVVHTRLNKKKITIAVAKVTNVVTAVGIWTKHDAALAKLIAQKIGEKQALPLGS